MKEESKLYKCEYTVLCESMYSSSYEKRYCEKLEDTYVLAANCIDVIEKVSKFDNFFEVVKIELLSKDIVQ